MNRHLVTFAVLAIGWTAYLQFRVSELENRLSAEFPQGADADGLWPHRAEDGTFHLSVGRIDPDYAGAGVRTGRDAASVYVKATPSSQSNDSVVLLCADATPPGDASVTLRRGTTRIEVGFPDGEPSIVATEGDGRILWRVPSR